MCRVNWKNKQAEHKYFVSLPDSFFVWSSDLTDLPLKMKEEMQNCTFSAKLSSGCTWLPFPNHIRKGLCVFLQPLFALTPGRQSGAAWHGEPGLWPLVPGPWRSSSSRTLFHLAGWVGAESAPSYLCWEWVVVNLFARFSAIWISPGNES